MTKFIQFSKRVLSKVLLPIGVLLLVQNSNAANLYTCKNKENDTLLTSVPCSNKSQESLFGQYATQAKVTWFKDTNVHTYRNWGGSEASVLPSYSRNRNAYDDLITSASSNFGVDQGLIKAIMHTESGFNPTARSPVGAQGLMQLMPATGRRFMVNDAYDPAQNISGGVKYLNFLLKRYNNNHELAIAAYNAGEGNVDKYHGIPPFRETQDYVRRVMSRFNNLYHNGIKITTGNDRELAARSSSGPVITYTNADGSASATFKPTNSYASSAFEALTHSTN